MTDGSRRRGRTRRLAIADPQSRAALSGRRILIVEDEMLVAMSLKVVLAEQGCEVLEPAPTIERAFAALSQQPDAVILDLNLGGRSTAPLADALRERGVPFVVVSGYDRAASDARAVADAPRIAKPFQPGELVRRLADALEAAQTPG